MQPTPEQETILSAAKANTANLQIRALAGTGKSTTLLMIERATPIKPCLILAFNKKIAEALEYKSAGKPEEAAKRVQSTTTVRTINGIGHRTWAATINRNLTLNAKKTNDILRGIIEEAPKRDREPLWEVFWAVVAGVGLAKALGYVPPGAFPNAEHLCSQSSFHQALEEVPDDLTADLIDLVLTRSITAAYAGNIDFNDQVYMPALFGGTYPRFPLVMVDERQDLNPVNTRLLRHLARGRYIGVGDPWQSIYGFRGAVQGGMDTDAADFSCEVLPLSVSFRCPQAIVENARWRVPHFKWVKEGGRVNAPAEMPASDFTDGAAILCRNNAPLFRLAMQLLGAGRSVSVAGSDIGPKLVGILRRLGDEDTSRKAVVGAIGDWEAEKLAKGSTTAADLAACMRVFAEHGSDLGQAVRYAEHLFSQTGSIRLMTGHKAKGLEFNDVYFLDSHLCRGDEQDLNLRYVMETRSLETLTYIDSEAIRW